MELDYHRPPHKLQQQKTSSMCQRKVERIVRRRTPLYLCVCAQLLCWSVLIYPLFD